MNVAVIAWGEALPDAETERIGAVEPLGLDEVAFARIGERRRLHFATSIADTRRGQLLDIVPGRGGDEPKSRIMEQADAWR